MEKEDLFNFEQLMVYKKALDFIDKVYSQTKSFPKSEEFRLTSQYIRASHSIALNIAEGSGRTKAEFINFLRISRRSVQECLVCSTIAHRQQYINSETSMQNRKCIIELSKMINGLSKSIK